MFTNYPSDRHVNAHAVTFVSALLIMKQDNMKSDSSIPSEDAVAKLCNWKQFKYGCSCWKLYAEVVKFVAYKLGLQKVELAITYIIMKTQEPRASGTIGGL